MDAQNVLFKIFLALGLAQTLLSTSGCTAPTASTPQTQEAEASRVDAQGFEDEPVRLSRAFFSRSLTGAVRLNGEEVQSDVSWNEYAATAPAPTEPVIADFRDRKGCASYDSADGIQLCFNIMPDVSSVGVNNDEVTLEGVCGGQFQNAKLVHAEKRDDGIAVTFQGSCSGQTAVAELTLRQI